VLGRGRSGGESVKIKSSYFHRLLYSPSGEIERKVFIGQWENISENPREQRRNGARW